MPDVFTQKHPGIPLVDWRAWLAVTDGNGHPGQRGGLWHYMLARLAQEKLGKT